MVNYCVCVGCTNSNMSGHRVHHFPGRKSKSFRPWVRFVQVKRADFTAKSVTMHSVICGAHFPSECYQPGDLMEFKMGFRSLNRVRLIRDAVPSIHAKKSSSSKLLMDTNVTKLPTDTTSGNSKPDLSKKSSEMAFIKEEGEDVGIDEAVKVKHEDSEDQTDLVAPKEESQEIEEKSQCNDFISGEIPKQTRKSSSRKRGRKTETNGYFSCCRCDKTFNQKQNLEVHMRVHTGEKPYVCQQCGKSFTQKQNLKVHMRIHTGEKPYSCTQCGQSFTHKGNLNTHMRNHTGASAFTCNLCGKSFSRKESLNTHMRIHTGEKPFVCGPCGKSFRCKVNLNCHMRIHSRDNRFICHQCGVSFAEGSKLKTHVATHIGEKPFMCHHCGKTCSNKAVLEVHVRVHTGERPFICPQCSKSFTLKGNLNIHIRVHTGEKPFSCLQCEKSFMYHTDLKRHLLTPCGKKL